MASPAAALAMMVFNPSSESKLYTSWAGAGSLGPFRGELPGRHRRMAADKIAGEPRPGHHPDQVAEGVVDVGAGFPRQGPGVSRRSCGPARPAPRRCSTRCPQPRQPIPQIQRVSDQRPSRHDPGAVQGAEFGGAVFRVTSGVPAPPQAQARWING